MKSRTNIMALVRSRQHEAHNTQWSHSRQPRWLPASHDTLAQEGNYLSQSRCIWQGDRPKVSAHVIRTARPAEWDHPPRDRLLGRFPTCHQGDKTLIKRPRRVESTALKGVTEVASKPLLRQPCPTPQSAAPRQADLP